MAAAAPNIFDAMLVASVKQKAGPAEAAREQSAKPIRGEELEAWIVDDPKTVRRRPSRPARPVVQLSNHAVLSPGRHGTGMIARCANADESMRI